MVRAGGDCRAADAGGASAAGPTARAASWRNAIEVPGSGALNAGGDASVDSTSCASAASCGAGGAARDGSGLYQAFVASEKNGRWGKAIEVPGLGALNAGGSASANSVSCGSARNCGAGGYYEDGSGREQAFVLWRA